MPVPVATETSQTEAEGQDSSDKPPHDPRSIPHLNSIPLPPPEAGTFTDSKQPGNTRCDLLGISTNGTQHKDHDLIDQNVGGSSSSPPSSPTLSDSEWSTPSTRPNSQAASRAQSMSESARPAPPVDNPRPAPPRRTASSAGSATASSAPAPAPVPQTGAASAPPTPAIKPRSRASSIASNKSGESHKFTLKELLASGPKLARRSSQKSVGSSKKSDSDGERKSVAGDSVGSLSAKYGVCQKVAIGKGATSVVRLAHKWDRTEEKLYAVKEFRKRRKNETEKEYVKKLTAEFCISSTLHHVNIVETVDLVQDEQKKWCEVMEFCPGGDLYAAIKKGGMSPSEVECCFKQILNGVGYLHSQGVAHRDIKPENLFFDTKGHLKIGDYGASTVYRLPWEQTIHMSTGLCGSEPYIAPEQFLGKPYDARLVDIWACGIVYYCLHFQELPWRAAQSSDSMYATYAEACLTSPPATTLIPPAPSTTTNDSSKVAHHSSTASSKNAPANCPQTISLLSPRACRPVIRKMLEPNPKLRCSIEEVLKAAWVVSIEVCYLVDKPSHIHTHARALADAKVQRMD